MANPPRPNPVPGPNPNPAPPAPQLTMQQFNEMGKLPDFIRDIQPFEGKPTELLVWLTDVEGVFDMFRNAGASQAQIDLIGRSVRRKIRGEAADILNSNNIMHDWADIKRTLLLYYRDKRDLKTLDFELTAIKKSAHESLGSYYSRVNELLASIIAQIQTEEKYFLHVNSHITYFKEKAVDAFIRGLEKPLCQLLKTHNPETLNHAYQFCLDYYNLDARSAPFRHEHQTPIPKPRDFESSKMPPRPPPRRPPPSPAPRNNDYWQQYPPNQQPPRPYYPQNNQQPPRPYYPPQQQQQPPRPHYQKPQPKPEPMDVDPSVRTRNVNYGNRPQQPPNQPQIKRQAHPLDTAPDAQTEQNQEFEYDYSQAYDPYGDYGTFETDTEGQAENPPQDEPAPSSSTNFLGWNPSW